MKRCRRFSTLLKEPARDVAIGAFFKDGHNSRLTLPNSFGDQYSFFDEARVGKDIRFSNSRNAKPQWV
jgi:hypothetical protein